MLVDRRLLKNLDWALIAVTLIIVAMGIIMVYSTTRNNAALNGGDSLSLVRRQIQAFIIGLIMVIGLMTFDYHISDRACIALYILNLMMLLAVALFGNEINGARSWLRLGPLGSFQPSEFAKILLIVTFGKYLSKKESLSSFADLIVPFIFVGAPLMLIMLQPDLGTGLVFTAIMFGMLFLAGARPKHLAMVIGAAVLVIVVWGALHHYFGFPLPLKQYQIDRLTIFLNPERDARGAGYNVIQSVTAVGSGRFFGKGLFHSTQARLDFLPEHHTDFIFAVFGEEFGFFGSFILLGGYFFLAWRGLRIAQHAKDRFGSLMAGGIVCMLLFHVLINVGMNIGIMPVTGIPLPFFSYGGTSMMANLLAIGLLINIWSRRLKIMF